MSFLGKPNLRLRPEKAKERPREEVKNIVVFGETGVGKSSLINLIAGERISETSSRASGCTLSYARHLLTMDGQQFAVWDTAGLGEGTQGTVPAEMAEAYLKKLLLDLSKAGGIDLLIYCVRGTRIRTALLANYNLFYSAICRKKVPICLAVTGLENQEGNMDLWWLKNQHQFSTLQMYFDDYACVTTLDSSVENPIVQERRRISRTALVKMIMETYRTEQWAPAGRSWIDTALSDIHTMLSPARDGDTARMAHVIMCDSSQHTLIPHKAVKLSVTIKNPVCIHSDPKQAGRFHRWMTLRSPVSFLSTEFPNKLPFNVGIRCTPERLFRIYQVPRKQAQLVDKDETRKCIVERGADLLIFCVQQTQESLQVQSQWEHFNRTYGGDLSPQIVVILGASDQQSAEEWWSGIVGVAKHGDASVAYLPTTTLVGVTDSKAASTSALQRLINTRCINCGRASFAARQHVFRRATVLPWMSEKGLGFPFSGITRKKTAQFPAYPEDSDILVETGVWQISPRT